LPSGNGQREWASRNVVTSHGNLRREHPLQRHAHHAAAFAHASGVEVVADFASDQFGRRRERVEREGHRERLLELEGAVGAAEHDAVEAAAIEREAEQARQFFVSRKIDFQNIFHCVSFATQVARAFSPSAQPSRLRSWR
jgi:hypothetical protein